MAEFVVVNAPLDKDLTPFSRYLWQQDIPHRIVTRADQQWLLVGRADDAKQVAKAYQHFCDGSTLPDIKHHSSKRSYFRATAVSRIPITLLFIGLSLIGYLLAKFDRQYEWVGLLTFYRMDIVGNAATLSIDASQYWRLITPIFLHFSLLHIVFNGLWLWDLGRRIELLKGSLKLLGLILIIGLGSNIAQFLFSEPGIFGGMSGVIYGLLGYGWVWSYLQPKLSLQIPGPVIYAMLAWLVLCMAGFAQAVAGVAVANAAHLGGLLIGIVLGAGAALIYRHQH